MIATLKEIKTLCNISSNDITNDDKINMLLPIIESGIHNHCKNHFIKADETIYLNSSTLSFDSENNKIIDSGNGFTDFKTKQNIKIFGSKDNDGICQVMQVSEDGSYIIVNSDLEIVDESEDSNRNIKIYRVLYPKELKLIMADMIKWKLKNKEGVASESFDDYSASYDTSNSLDYPGHIIKALNRYTKLFKKEY